MLKTTELYYFSPTGGTKKVGEAFCSEIAESVKGIDLGIRNRAVEQPSDDIVVVAAPVFGGRIPAFMADKLKKLNGDGKKVITLAIYGNRAYEDALLELNDAMMESGFQVLASGAFVAQHSMAPEVGAGRPDEEDLAEICDFAKKVLDKLENGAKNDVKVPGNHPYKNGMNMPATPISLPACNQCGKCESVCPTGAIRLENDAISTKPDQCILCMACVSACPQKARILPPPLQETMEQKLGVLKSVRGKNEKFL